MPKTRGKGKKKVKSKKSKNGQRKLTRMNYSRESVHMALDEVRKGGKLHAVSAKYGIPESTLRAKKNNKYADKKPGPPTVLTEQEEQDLEVWVFEMCNRGFPVTKHEFVQSVKMICVKLNRKNPFVDDTPGRHWYESFLERHPKIATRIAENVNLNKANLSEKSIRLWFSIIRDYLGGMDLLKIAASRIFNGDETGVPLNPSDPSVLAPKGHKLVFKIVGNNEKENVTVLIVASADGTLAPPFILYKGASLPENAANFAPDDYTFGYSENGYMTAKDFYEYVANVYEPWLEEQGIERPVIFYIDGHASHMTMELSKFCADHEIILIALHPNATHMMQPLDVSFFKPFKDQWKKSHREFCRKTPCVGIEKYQVPIVLKDTLSKIDCTRIIPKGFEKCGLSPFNVEAVDFTKVFHRSDEEDISEQSEEPSTNPDSEILLKAIEQHISEATLDSFRLNGSSEWMGNECDKSLYELWYKLAHPRLNTKDSGLEQNQVQERRIHESSGNSIVVEIDPLAQEYIQSLDNENFEENLIPECLNSAIVAHENKAPQPPVGHPCVINNEQQRENILLTSSPNTNGFNFLDTEEVVDEDFLANMSLCESDLFDEPQNDESRLEIESETVKAPDEIVLLNQRRESFVECIDLSTSNHDKSGPSSHVTRSDKPKNDQAVETELSDKTVANKGDSPTSQEEPMEDITNTIVRKQKEPSAKQYLSFPSIDLDKKKKRRKKSQPNNPVISSREWRDHKQAVIDEKNSKEAEILARKKIKIEKAEETKTKKLIEQRIKKETIVEKNRQRLEKEKERIRIQQEKLKALEEKTEQAQAELMRQKKMMR